jgi:hypothetical protein
MQRSEQIEEMNGGDATNGMSQNERIKLNEPKRMNRSGGLGANEPWRGTWRNKRVRGTLRRGSELVSLDIASDLS